jgi:dinuclear metal center YbgI/SA1388 family protein
MKLFELINELESVAPLQFQEDYDNCGLLTGNKTWEVKGILLSLDCTEEIIDEAINTHCNVVVAHHPVIFTGLKKLNGNSYVERTIIKAIQNNIAIYACHTNLDNIQPGVNQKIAQKIGLSNCTILAPKSNLLRKIVTYVPETHHQAVLNALFEAGAGNIGNYDSCSFNTTGIGTFKGNEKSTPFLGQKNQLSKESETRIETIFEQHKENQIIKALLDFHPYEEVAYDLYSVNNKHLYVGSGMIGELASSMDEISFLKHIKKVFRAPIIKHTRLMNKPIQKVAICGGSGRFLLKNAIHADADAFITADFKYHDYFEVDNRLLLLDIGHYESEQFTPEIFYNIIIKKFPTFAIRLSKINTNPINCF